MKRKINNSTAVISSENEKIVFQEIETRLLVQAFGRERSDAAWCQQTSERFEAEEGAL